MNYFFHSQDEKVTYHVLKLNDNFKSLYDIAIIFNILLRISKNTKRNLG